VDARPECQSAAEEARVATPAVLYAAKSTEDVHGSIPTQLADGRELAEREGLDVVDELSDEAASAYKGDRGAGLARALEQAEDHARVSGEAVLIVQHSDRLARGDGRQAKHLVEYALWAIKANVRILSVQDPQTFGDLLYAVVTGQRNHEDSARKGKATAAGHRRRFQAGKRLGSPIPDGYRLDPVLDEDGRPMVGRDGRAVRDVALDPARAPLWRRIFDMVEHGHTCGEVRETLNADGIRKQRGGAWRTRDIRRGILNDWYCGRARAYGETIDDDHPALIEPERWERIAAMIRTDERASKGGRPPIAEADDYLLRGIASCMRCESSLYTRRLASGRQYVCRSVRESTGCDANYIPAASVEQAVLDHLDSFIANVRGWLEQRTAQSAAERDRFAELVDGQRRELRKLERRVEGAHAQYERLLEAGDDELADAALGKAIGFEAERDHVTLVIFGAEAQLAEWPAPDVDEALDIYTELQNAVSGRVDGSKTLQQLRATLRAVLAYAHLDYRAGELFGEFGLRPSDDVLAGRLPFGIQVTPGGAVGAFSDDGSHRGFELQGAPEPTWVRELGEPKQEEPNTTC